MNDQNQENPNQENPNQENSRQINPRQINPKQVNRNVERPKGLSKTNKKNPKHIFIFILLITVIFSIYFLQRGKQSEVKVEIPNTEAQKLLAKDLDTEYPKTPTSVVKLYSRISKCLYNDKWDNDQVNELIEMIRKLYSKELLANNPKEKYLTTFKADIAEYKDKKKTIMTYRVEGNSQVVSWEKEGIEYASLKAVYSMAEGKGHYKIYEEFLMKKDVNKQWKLLGWKTVPEFEIVED